jgi:Protein of unknown function (DUF6044)
MIRRIAGSSRRTQTLMHLALVSVIFGYLAPHISLGESSHVLIFDQLDSMFVDLKVLSESHLIFARADALIPNLAGGLPRAFLPSGFYVPVWLMYLFGPYHAYLANQVCLRLVAYFGMNRLLARHVLVGDGTAVPAALASLAFALLPFYSLLGLSIAGQPLILSAFLNIRRGEGHRRDWLIIAAMPLYSLSAFAGPFTLCLAVGVWVYDLIRTRIANRRFFAAVLMFALVSVVVDYQLVVSMLAGSAGWVVSHRVEIKIPAPGVAAAYDASFLNFMYGQEHAPSLQRRVILPVIVFALLVLTLMTAVDLYRRNERSRRGIVLVGAAILLVCLGGYLYLGSNPARFLQLVTAAYTDRQTMGLASKCRATGLDLAFFAILALLARSSPPPYRPSFALLLRLLALSMLISLWYGFWPKVWGVLKVFFPHLIYMNLSRFHYFHPTLWCVLFGVALTVIWRHVRLIGRPIVLGLAALQVIYLFSLSQERTERVAQRPTYKEFFSAHLFKDVANFIGRNKGDYRVCSVGLFPSIASFNGFHTLDGYSQNYPLSHKRRFRRLIAGELNESPFYRDYFDNWGSRYYVFSREIRTQAESDAFLLTRKTVQRYAVKVSDLRFDVAAFRSLGGEYVFSAVEIGNARDLGLDLLHTFEPDDSPWRIFLYAARPSVTQKPTATPL